ncbi:MAG TPA: alanine dehydrogenase, partial [Pseudonocardiaceae bacterium]|nr:alanine dehydrogenase [Pseudonocardiaceae bacterium]
MKIAVPQEIKNNEYRVALTPAGAHELTSRGHTVFVQAGAGAGSAIPDEEYLAAGAKVLAGADDVWAEGELVLKVKEPIAAEYPRLRPDLVLFTYLHLAADEALTRALLDSGTTGVAYETVQTAGGALPLLAPMSEVAGRLAPQVGA